MNPSPSTTFHMPVFEGAFFDEATEHTFRQTFPLIETECGDAVKALQVMFYLPDALGERCIAQNILAAEPSFQTTEHMSPAGLAAWQEACTAWSQDRLAEQSLLAMPFPWKTQDMGPRLSGKMIEVLWTPAFTIVAQEFIPIFLEYDTSDPLGPNESIQNRVAMASLLLPPATNRHQALANRGAFDAARPQFEALWSHLIGEMNSPILCTPDGLDTPLPAFEPL